MIECSPDLYAKVSLEAAESYISGVMDGSISTSTWIKKAVERGLRDRKSNKWTLDYKQVNEVFKFCSRLKIPDSKGKVFQFRLSPYQAWMVLEIFLYYEEDGSRRFTEVVYWTGRKSGKTMIAAIISFYLGLEGGYSAPEIYFAASGSKQATVLLNYCKQVQDYSHYLSARCEERAFDIKTKNRGVFSAVANKVGGELDGRKPLVTILDECHSLPDSKLRNAFKRGMNWSTDTLFLSISTAGSNIMNFFYKQIKAGKMLLESESDDDDKTLYFLFSLDDGDLDRDDLMDNPDIWIKANPNLGVTPPLKTFRNDLKKAFLMEEDKSEFIVKNFNVFDDSFDMDRLFSMTDINRNSVDLNIEDFYGSRLYLGLDLAPKIDISALGAVIEKDGKYYMWSDLFCAGSKDALYRKGTTLNIAEYSDHININWHNATTDYRSIVDRVEFYRDNFDLVAVGHDPAYSGTMASDINMLGVDTYPVKQYHASFNECVMMMENHLAEDNLTVDSNPLLRYMFYNSLCDTNNQGMRMPAKKESKIHGDAIDGVMAILMGWNMYLGFNVETSAIYNYLQKYMTELR